MKGESISIWRLYGLLFIFIAVAFVIVNIVGYGLKRSFFPTHLKEGVVEEFLFPIKMGNIDHAIELLSPSIDVIENPAGEKIGVANDGHFWSFKELALCEGGMDDTGQYLLTNGAVIEVVHPKKISVSAGRTSFPWNERAYLQKERQQRIETTIDYIRGNMDDTRSWRFGMNELGRLTGRDLPAEFPGSRDERERILHAIR